jgi:hypothetical protein
VLVNKRAMQFRQGFTLRRPPQMKTMRAGDVGIPERFASPERESSGQVAPRVGRCGEVAKCRGVNRELFTSDADAIRRNHQPWTK